MLERVCIIRIMTSQAVRYPFKAIIFLNYLKKNALSNPLAKTRRPKMELILCQFGFPCKLPFLEKAIKNAQRGIN